MAWEDIEEVTALELSGKKFDPETTYVMLERDTYPKTLKIKLSELKKWMTVELNSSLESVSNQANDGNPLNQMIGPIHRELY